MADVFISYARTDRARIEKLAAALEGAGLPVWWDHRIDAGSEFTKDIERELRAAKAVIVAWSSAGAASPWVRDEASLAKTLGTLLPIRLDAEAPPLGFQQFHAFDFSGWRGDPAANEFATLLASVRRRIAGETAAPFSQPAAPAPAGLVARLRRNKVPALVGAGVAFVAVLGLALFVFRAPSGGPPSAAPEGAAEMASADQSQAATKGDGDVATGGATGGVGLAVLPFANLSSDPEQEHFADGLTEELLNWLANVEGLKVPGRTTSFQYKGKADDLRTIGAALGVDYVLEGSVRRSGDALRITAQLIEAKTGYHLWSETYDRKLADIFAIQDEVARIVVTELLGKIPETGAANPAAVGDVDPKAHELYLEGRALWAGRDHERAFGKFREAIAVDPRHALAQAYLAVVAANVREGSLAGVDAAAADQALAAAVKLKPLSADVLFAQGWVAEMQSGPAGVLADPGAIAFYERAARANPRHVEALHALARRDGLSAAQQIELYERVLDIDPGLSTAVKNLVAKYMEVGAHDKALALARKSLAVSRREPAALVGKALGDTALVGEALFRDFDAVEGHFVSRHIQASALASLGARDEARFLFERERKRGDPFGIAGMVVAELGGDEEAHLRAAQEIYRRENAPRFAPWALARAEIGAGKPANAYETLLAHRPGLAKAEVVVGDFVDLTDLGDIELLTAAHALARAGRRGEAQALWRAALATAKAEPATIWPQHLNLALLYGNLGDRAAATAAFQDAYDAGFRYLWSYDCDGCAHDGFYAAHGLFAPLMEIPEIAAIVARIEADNAKTLEDFNRKYGILDKVRAMMAAERAAANDDGR